MSEHEEIGREEGTSTQGNINPQQQRYREYMQQQTQGSNDVHREGKIKKLKRFATECRRVLKITKKPSGEEFKTIVKVSGAGMLLMGFIGFVIVLIKQLIFG